MKKLFVVAILLMATKVTHAQISNEILFGNRQVHYLNYWQKDIDSAGKFNFFNINRFAIDHNDKLFNNFSNEGQLSYRLKDWIGISVGGGFDGEVFMPTLGLNLSYLNKKGDFFIEAYPTIGIAKRVAPSIFGLIGYNPTFDKKWGLSSQLIFTVDELQSSQLVRVGLNFKNKLQFGIGADIYQFQQAALNFSNVGIFVRVNL